MHPDPPPLWLRGIAAVLAGATLSVLVPPLNLHWLHWVAYLPMFWALHPETPRQNRALAFLYGTVAVGMLFRWIAHTITVFSPFIPGWGAFGILGLFAMAFGLPYLFLWTAVHPLRRRLGLGWIVALPALQVLLEWMSAFLLLFPYNQGVTQYRSPYTWQLASVTGVWGLTYLVFLVNAAWAEALYRRREGRPFPVSAVAGALGVLATVVLFGAWRYERVEAVLREAPTLRVAQLQSGVGMEVRLGEPPMQGFQEWLRMTQSIPDGTQLAVWPEGACPYNLNSDSGLSDLPQRILGDVARDRDIELVIGGGTRVREADAAMGETSVSIFNSVYHFDTAGQSTQRYDKMVPLPFGEYLPFGEWLPGLGRALGIGDFKAGDTAVVFDQGVARMASPICYEAILGHVCRWFDDPELFVTVTNDAWFGDTAAPHQHAMLAAARATELGIPMLRSAYTGVSLVAEPHGVIHAETQAFEEVTRVVHVRLGTVPTLYGRFGDWFVWLCGLGLAGAWAWVRFGGGEGGGHPQIEERVTPEGTGSADAARTKA